MLQAALSTMWGVGRCNPFSDFFKQASSIGFSRFELNHGVNSAMLDGSARYAIASVHEPCPADISVGTLKQRNWLISALDEDDRLQGVNATKRSIDLAVKLGASTVIVHPGRVDVDLALDRILLDLFREGKMQSPEYARAKEQLVAARSARAEANFAAAKRSLVELAGYAAARRVKLGLENRYHFHEIPLPDELDALLALGYDDTIGFWYDTGHAQTLDRLGHHRHEEWLQRFADRIIGVHLHDVVGIGDHRAAGTGEINWDRVASYIPKDALRTCEFQNDNSPQQVKDGVAWLAKKGIVEE